MAKLAWVAKALAISSSSGSKSRSSVKRKLNWPFAWPPKLRGMINNGFIPSQSREERRAAGSGECGSRIREALRSYLLGLGIKTLLIIPLSLGGQANGQLSFRFTEERDFDREELEIARALA